MEKHEIKLIRQSLGLTQAQLARLLGIHPVTISTWERGKTVPSAWQEAMLEHFRDHVLRCHEDMKPELGLPVLLESRGMGAVLAVLLRHLL